MKEQRVESCGFTGFFDKRNCSPKGERSRDKKRRDGNGGRKVVDEGKDITVSGTIGKSFLLREFSRKRGF